MAALVLGIHDGTHDAGAALVRGGRVLAACNEERFDRRKGSGGWPGASIRACLATVGADPRDVELAAFAGVANPNPVLRALRPLQRRFHLDDGGFYAEDGSLPTRLSAWAQFESPFPRVRAEDPAGRAVARALRTVLARRAGREGVRAPVVLHDHHHCHAAGAWYTTGWERGLVVVADGVGDGLALSVWAGEGPGLRRLAAWPYPHSYGLLYATLTGFLGFRPFRHEGKLVGLAALGDADAVPLPFPFEGPPDARRFTQAFGTALRPWLERLRPYRREDVCAWLQRGVEADLGALVAHWTARTGLRRVALSGGVFANVRLNQHLGGLVDALSVHPHMGDGGLAVGAALATAAGRGELAEAGALRHAYLGPAWDDRAVAAELDRLGVGFRRPQDLEEQVADRLARGQIVARFEGAMEYGPRALGHRSILAAAADRTMTDRLNVALDRSDFMPFAPAIAAEAADDWVDGLAPVRAAAAFMTVTAQARPALARACPAAVHVDGSLRPQLVAAEVAPSLHRTLLAFGRRTGVPALINTSFNLHEEPIVCSPAEAVATWRRARLDALAIGPFLVTREGAPA